MQNTKYDKVDWKNKTPAEKREYWNNKSANYRTRKTGKPSAPRRQIDYGILRECAVCKEKKERTSQNFYRSKAAREGFQTTCKPCAGNISTSYIVLEKYGLSLAQYRAMLKDARCEICFSVERLVLDHCHEHDHIRAVLCHHCNTGLGHFRDDPDSLQRAIEYLHRHRPKTQLQNP